MSLDDVFNQISKVSLFTRPTETKLPVRARKDKKGKSTKKKKGRWNHLDQNSGKDSEDEDAPILAVLPRKPPPRGSPQPKFSSSRDSVSKGASSETEPSTPQAALQQLLSDTAGSMGIAAWSPPKGDAPQESTESPPPTVEEAPILSQKGSRSALEDLLQQASANAASAARRKKAHRGNFQLGKKNSQVRQKGSKTGEDDEPILAVLPRRPPTPHLPTSVQGNFKSIPGNPLNQEASPQEALQQLLANSMGASSWAELESSKKTEAADGIQEDSEEGNTTQAANVAPAGGSLPQSLQRRSSSDAPSGPQSTGTHEAKVPEEAAENAESTNEESTVAPRTAAAAAAAWDMRKAILAARKAAEAAKAARAAATSAKGISGKNACCC
ncbi:uncharacterized protein EMH_0006290 [Eimeria mitis]|uniref:Uncharacterized protein n=1 Tax=Eimeria mitis TaxID=44415 RepID=U6JY46_9EIME|nr:uncharacterized protein EMH_0006290 [Eimeria mitis]CDJ30390.1 hypothetical protein, conserved [Eimeria mitis]